MRLLGVDYGRAKIGFALGDDESGVAAPVETVRLKDGEAPKDVIIEMVRQEGPDAVVIGVPQEVGAFHSKEQLEEVRSCIKEVRREVHTPVFEIDESHTSKEAQRIQKEQGSTASEDALAAMVLLQAWIDAKRRKV